MNGRVAVPIGKLVSRLTLEIRITGARAFAWRLWLATLIVRLDALVAGTQVYVAVGPRPAFDEQRRTGYRRYLTVGKWIVPSAHSIYLDGFPDWGPHVDIFLDGVRQDQVVSFDVDAGCVRVHRLVGGRVVVEGDEIATEIRRGKVELRERAGQANASES